MASSEGAEPIIKLTAQLSGSGDASRENRAVLSNHYGA